MKTKPGDVPMHFPRGGFTALLFAARGGFTECAKILLDHGADIKAADPDGTSALVLAIINGHFDTAAFLLDRKADPNAADSNGRAAAVRRGRHARHLSEQPSRAQGQRQSGTDGPDQNAARSWSRSQREANQDDRPRAVLDFPDMMMGEGATPFLRAAKSADIPLMQLLLDKGADPKVVTKAGVTALMVAAGMGHHEAPFGAENSRIEA